MFPILTNQFHSNLSVLEPPSIPLPCQPFFLNKRAINFEFESCNNIENKFSVGIPCITRSVALHAFSEDHSDAYCVLYLYQWLHLNYFQKGFGHMLYCRVYNYSFCSVFFNQWALLLLQWLRPWTLMYG